MDLDILKLDPKELLIAAKVSRQVASILRRHDIERPWYKKCFKNCSNSIEELNEHADKFEWMAEEIDSAKSKEAQ
jgi:hypothetical protein